MVVFDDDVFALVFFDVFSVDFFAGVFAGPHGTDIEVVFQNALHCGDGPGGSDRSLVVLALGLLALALRHAWRGDAFIGQMVGDPLIAPALPIEPEDGADDLGFRGDDLELLLMIDDVTVGRGTEPLPVLLPPLYHSLDLPGGIGNGHLVDEKLELDFQPVIVVGEVDPIADGDDADAVITQILQLHQPPAVAAGEAGKVFDNQNVDPVIQHLLSHAPVAFPLLKGVAGAVPVFIKGEGASGKSAGDEILDNGLLVFDGGVVSVQLFIDRDAAITGNVKCFCQLLSPHKLLFTDNIVSCACAESKGKSCRDGGGFSPFRSTLREKSGGFLFGESFTLGKPFSVVPEQRAGHLLEILLSRTVERDEIFFALVFPVQGL